MPVYNGTLPGWQLRNLCVSRHEPRNAPQSKLRIINLVNYIKSIQEK